MKIDRNEQIKENCLKAIKQVLRPRKPIESLFALLALNN